MADEIISDPEKKKKAFANLRQACNLMKDTSKLITETGTLHQSEKQKALMIFLSTTCEQIAIHSGYIIGDDLLSEYIIGDDLLRGADIVSEDQAN